MTRRKARHGHDHPVVPVAVAASGAHPPIVAAVHASSAPQVDETTDADTIVDPDLPWDVIVWDDPVTLMSYVVWVFKRVLQVPEPVATRLMLEVHKKGKALVASHPRERAELVLQQLLQHGLKATIQRSR